MAAGNHATAFDTKGYLPNLYAKYGYYPIARVAFDPKLAPEGWKPEMGMADVVVLVRDPDHVTEAPRIDGDYLAKKKDIPLVSYDKAVEMQKEAVAKVAAKTGLTGVDKAIVDYIRERPMTDPEKVVPISDYLGKDRARYVPYSQTPFFNQVSAMHWDASKPVGGEEYKKSRDEFFNKLPVTDISLDKLVVTQPDVNKDELKSVANRPDLDLSKKPAHAVRYNGETYILNGHHRLVTAVDAGLKTVKAHLLDLDATRREEASPELSKEARDAREAAAHSVWERATKIARAHMFTGRVDVVDKTPREFDVGTRHCTEAGHYNPSDRSIEINGRVVDDDALPLVVAHECQHDKWNVVQKELAREHEAISKKIHEEPGWFDKTFRVSGEPRTEEARAELERDYPVSTLFGKTVGDSYCEFGGSFEKAKKDDGVSNYSKAYWSPEALNKNFSIDRAYDETLAEIARIQLQPLVLREGDRRPSKLWKTLFIGINHEYERLT